MLSIQSPSDWPSELWIKVAFIDIIKFDFLFDHSTRIMSGLTESGLGHGKIPGVVWESDEGWLIDLPNAINAAYPGHKVNAQRDFYATQEPFDEPRLGVKEQPDPPSMAKLPLGQRRIHERYMTWKSFLDKACLSIITPCRGTYFAKIAKDHGHLPSRVIARGKRTHDQRDEQQDDRPKEMDFVGLQGLWKKCVTFPSTRAHSTSTTDVGAIIEMSSKTMVGGNV